MANEQGAEEEALWGVSAKRGLFTSVLEAVSRVIEAALLSARKPSLNPSFARLLARVLWHL